MLHAFQVLGRAHFVDPFEASGKARVVRKTAHITGFKNVFSLEDKLTEPLHAKLCDV